MLIIIIIIYIIPISCYTTYTRQWSHLKKNPTEMKTFCYWFLFLFTFFLNWFVSVILIVSELIVILPPRVNHVTKKKINLFPYKRKRINKMLMLFLRNSSSSFIWYKINPLLIYLEGGLEEMQVNNRNLLRLALCRLT